MPQEEVQLRGVTMFMETDETESVLDARFVRLEEFEHLADQIEAEAALIVRALRPPALPEHGSVDDALKLIAVLAPGRGADSPRNRLAELIATALKLAFDHAEAEGATYKQMGDASGKAAPNVHKYRRSSHAAA